MNFKDYKHLIFSDLYRVTKTTTVASLIWEVMSNTSFQYNFWMRTSAYTRQVMLWRYSIYPLARFFLSHLKYKLGISIPYYTNIGSGFYIGHFGGIVVNGRSIIGKNCNISHGVTIGMANRGRNKGYPCIGDNVYIGPGAKIIGAVKVGNHVAIGANSVVTHDVPDNAVVVGIPARVISYASSLGYIENTEYDALLLLNNP